MEAQRSASVVSPDAVLKTSQGSDVGRGNYVRGNRLTPAFLESVSPPPIHAVERVLLYDFDTGRPDLLPMHVEGLHQFILPFLQPSSPPCSVWIGGLASRRGDESINIPLARHRAVNVATYLLASRPHLLEARGRHSVVSQSFGERLSRHTENSEYYRSALVVVSRLAPYRPPRRPPPPSVAMAFHHFRIRSHGVSVDGGEVWGLGSYGFEVDYDIGMSGCPPSSPAIYRLRAYGGVAGGLPAGVGLADRDGPWNRFTMPIVTTTRGLEGRASIAGHNVQVLRWTISSETALTLKPDAANGAEVSIDPFVSSGAGFAAAFGVLVGDFELIEGAQ